MRQLTAKERYELYERSGRNDRHRKVAFQIGSVGKGMLPSGAEHTCVRCGHTTTEADLPHCPNCGYDGTGQFV